MTVVAIPISSPTVSSVATRSICGAGRVKLTNHLPKRSLGTRAEEADVISLHSRVITELDPSTLRD